MTDTICSDLVRFGGDINLAPVQLHDDLNAHLETCIDCSTYVAQMAATRDVLGRLAQRNSKEVEALPFESDRSIQEKGMLAEGNQEHLSAFGDESDAAQLRSDLLSRAELVDPENAQDLVHRALEVGYALQQRDARVRNSTELMRIIFSLAEAQQRFESETVTATDLTAATYVVNDSLAELDTDADFPELFYPELYPIEDELNGWVDSPRPWQSNVLILEPDQTEELNEVEAVLNAALEELPEPLGELLNLVDLNGETVRESGLALGLDVPSATSALSRARNHVRGRLDTYINGAAPNHETVLV